jgi:hypothetical protein
MNLEASVTLNFIRAVYFDGIWLWPRRVVCLEST